MFDALTCIRDYNAGRDPERLVLKYRNMRASPFVFLRGTCHLFYDRLPNERIFRHAPAAWVCGDLHLENFGSYKGDNRLAYFDLNDFDEAALAPCTWDPVRLLTSILVAAASLKVNRAEALALGQVFLEGYANGLAQGKARWIERDTAEGLVRELLDSLRNRPRSAFLDSRSTLKSPKGRKRVLRADGRKALPASAKQRAKVEAFMAAFAKTQPNPEFYKVIDVARRIAGTGSLGVDRYAILVAGKGSPDGNYILDLKEALPSSLVPHLHLKQPRWKSEAERVVAVQRRSQAVSMAFLQPVTMGKKAYILRGLLPSEDRVALDGGNGRKLRRLESVLRTMGELAAWDQLRSSGRDGSASADELIDFGHDPRWRPTLLSLAEGCAEQVKDDWKAYATAYDDGFYTL
ncbi:DUF2252 domain-containing protein [Oryzomicrobium sp.]|uniref:DUF2252 domain-containing protein n=1 Tax=Oryzomicrobium sp. TaxID=1911578 RepID=UPI0025E2B034|nr:DUF2252 domain-containing protein [Oryzomicrobium sp.]MCE1241913.1 DUF2252 domain-containing protein [Oryzomicrobium sp.]